jgi:hypothetical protein
VDWSKLVVPSDCKENSHDSFVEVSVFASLPQPANNNATIATARTTAKVFTM